MKSIIVAYAKNLVIGRSNDLPWHIPEDLKRFKQLTTGHTVIMGRNTYLSILARLGHGLPERRNIVISDIPDIIDSGVEIAESLDDALKMSEDGDPAQEIFIIGGARVYADSMAAGVADRIYATEIDKEIAGDVYFPKIDKNEWHETRRKDHQDNSYKYSFVTFERRK